MFVLLQSGRWTGSRRNFRRTRCMESLSSKLLSTFLRLQGLKCNTFHFFSHNAPVRAKGRALQNIYERQHWALFGKTLRDQCLIKGCPSGNGHTVRFRSSRGMPKHYVVLYDEVFCENVLLWKMVSEPCGGPCIIFHGWMVLCSTSKALMVKIAWCVSWWESNATHPFITRWEENFNPYSIYLFVCFLFFFQLKAFFLSSVLSSPLSLVFQMHLISNSYFCLLVSSYTGHFLYLRVKSSRLSGEASVQSPALPLTVSAGDCQVSEWMTDWPAVFICGSNSPVGKFSTNSKGSKTLA